MVITIYWNNNKNNTSIPLEILNKRNKSNWQEKQKYMYYPKVVLLQHTLKLKVHKIHNHKQRGFFNIKKHIPRPIVFLHLSK